MAGQKTINTVTPAIGAIKIQQSTYGLVLPIVWGMTRLTGDLLWYGDFKATPHTTVTQSGGKGGGAPAQSSTTFTYSASVAMLLCEGPIITIRTAWRGKKIYGGSAYGGATRVTTEIFGYHGAPIAVANTADWADVSVERVLNADEQGDYKYYRGGESEPLSRNVDYTAVGGLYTFVDGAVADGELIRIRYAYASPAAGSSSLASLGMNLFRGTPGQAAWPYLTTNHPDQALGYSSIAYVAAANYALDDGASVENHSFEVESAFRFSSTIPDASPAVIVVDAMSNPQYGAGFGAEKLLTADYAAACAAQGIFLSPALTEQTSAADFLAALAALTNVGLVWSGSVLKFVPYTDVAITGNGVTFTPNTAPIYDLTDDDFQGADEEGPIKVLRGSPSDTCNSVSLEYLDRANSYNIGIMPAQDQPDIQETRLRPMPTIKAHWITEASVAKIVAQLILQRSLFVRNTYQFKLGWTKIGLEPMDLVTLTDPVLMTRQPVRILTIEEDDAGYLDVVAEDFPKGSASATLYPSASGAGFAHDYNESPGVLGAPVIFEAPAALATQEGGLEVWLAAGNSGATYGGCEVWVSLTGANYERAAVLHGASRFGVTTSPLAATAGTTTETVGVSLTAGGQILAGSIADMNALSTLCYVGGEFIGYETATLNGGSAYTLGNHMLRGAYLSAPVAHSAGADFVRCDEAIARMPLSPDYIGKTLHIKLLPFNRYGGGTGDLASAVEYTYTVTGAQANNPPVAPSGLALEGAFTINTAKFKWNRVSNASTYNAQVYHAGAMVREVNVGDALRFDYSYADAKVDGGPWRDLTFKVQGIHANGAPGAFSTLAVSNLQVGGLTGVIARGGLKTVLFACDRPVDPDFHGVLICLSAVSGFTPGDATLVYDGPNTAVTLTALRGGQGGGSSGLAFRNTRIGAALVHGDTHFLVTGGAGGQALVNGVTYYLRAAAYDTFDRVGLTWSAEISVTPAEVEIPAGSITAEKLADSLSSRINLIDAEGTGLLDKVAALNATYGSTAAAATSAASAAQAAADAVAAQAAALVSAGNAGTAATASNASRVAADSANAAAATSASAAATSASDASSFSTTAGSAAAASNASKVSAESASGTAQGAATAAVAARDVAVTKADQAGTSATSASTSASTASTKAGEASSSATNAATSASNAAGSASSASSSAINAATSANASGDSATAAAGSASSASTQATNASNSATAANSARVSAESARDAAGASASAASTSASTASTKASDAAASASAASSSSNTASTAAASAATYRDNAASSASTAQGYASASALDYSAINARLNNAGGTGVSVETKMTAVADAVTGLNAQYTVKLDVNGYVAGIGVANDGASSPMVLYTSALKMVAPGAAAGSAGIEAFDVTSISGVPTMRFNGVIIMKSATSGARVETDKNGMRAYDGVQSLPRVEVGLLS